MKSKEDEQDDATVLVGQSQRAFQSEASTAQAPQVGSRAWGVTLALDRGPNSSAPLGASAQVRGQLPPRSAKGYQVPEEKTFDSVAPAAAVLNAPVLDNKMPPAGGELSSASLRHQQAGRVKPESGDDEVKAGLISAAWLAGWAQPSHQKWLFWLFCALAGLAISFFRH